MTFVDTDELLKVVKENQPVNCSELTKLMGFASTKPNITRVYNKIKRLALDGIIKTKRCGGSRIVWINKEIGD